jgi:hypothetical protein
MNDNKKTDRANFLSNGSWYQMYMLSKYWKSDLEFYRDDLHFLYLLIDKYFIWIVKPENLKIVEELKNKLVHLNLKSKDLILKMSKHTIQLGYMVDSPNNGNIETIKTEHEDLEQEIAEFVTMFRENRKEVFSITEYIIDSEKLASIINA